MELEEAVEILKNFIKYFEAEATARKFRRSITIVVDEDDIEAIETVLKYIKEESISKTVVEEKIKQLKEQSGGNVFHIQQTINSNIRLLQEILNKGE